MTLNDWLSRRRLYTPQRIGVVDDANQRRYTYAELDVRATRVAGQLQAEFGILPGDRVACLAGNRIEYIDLYFACGKLGAVLVPLNFRLPGSAVAELVEDCAPGVLVYERQFAHLAETASQADANLRRWPMNSSPGDADSHSSTPWGEASSAVGITAHQADELDTAMILYTSGTTGRSKGAMISYRQIHWNALNTIIGLQLTQEDASFLNMPLFHTGGWHVLFTPLMLLGGRVILQPRFDAERCNALLGPEGITILFGVPTTLRMMREAPNFAAADFATVRFAIFGGETCPLPVIEAYAQRGIAMRQGYGLTEAGPNCFSLPSEAAIRKQGSIGFPNFHVDVRLQKPDGGEAGAGEVGELLMRGPHLFNGYWNDPAATAAALQDGWLATGDLMQRDNEGYYFVVGRKKEMYVSGGENVYPAQVERVIQRHPAVALAAVFGVPDPQWGETGCAFVKLHADQTTGEETLRAWCRQHLAKFQCPTKILVVDDLPLGPSGKVDKLTLAEQARQWKDS